MKILTLISTQTYPEFQAVITGNSFGDQIIEYIYDHADGSRENFGYELQHEGNWLNEREIKSFGMHLLALRGLAKKAA